MAHKENQETGKTKRRDSRVQALLVLFQLKTKPADHDLSIDQAVEMTEGLQDELKLKPDMNYMTVLVEGVLGHQETLNKLIENYLTNWKIDRLNKIDLIILQIATYELKYELGQQADLAEAMIINEAIEIAKAFSDEKSAKFINAVLSNMAADLA